MFGGAKVQKNLKSSKIIYILQAIWAIHEYFVPLQPIMRRIQFLLPIVSMRGAIAPRERYLYPQNNNEGWYAPDGTNTATNYRAKLIAAKKNDTGRAYYMVRTKTTINWNANTRTNTAIFAGACAIYKGIIATPNIYNALVEVAKAARTKETLRVFTFPYLQDMLKNKEQDCQILAGDKSVTIDNAWQKGGVSDVPVRNEIFEKYKDILS